MTIGIPRSLYYYLEPKWLYFFEYLNFDVVISEESTTDILKKGTDIINDEVCLSLKMFMGHVATLIDKCDYLFLLRIDNFGTYNQTCANYVGIYEIVKNQFNIKIIDANIEGDEKKAFLEVGKKLNLNRKKVKKAYQYATIKHNKEIKKSHQIAMNKLKSSKKKILLVGHSYNIKDRIIGSPIINILKKYDCEIIYSCEFDNKLTNKLSSKLCPNLYFKYNKDNIGTIELIKDKIDGVIFLTAFPCGLDSLVNELVMLKLNKPYLNLIVDDVDSTVGYETRIESFIDIIKKVNYV